LFELPFLSVVKEGTPSNEGEKEGGGKKNSFVFFVTKTTITI